MALYYYSNGTIVLLGQKIASGGEGVVYNLGSSTTEVVKIYKNLPSRNTQQKLKKLVGMTPIANCAWPKKLVFNSTNGMIIGYIMNKLQGVTWNNLNMECSRALLTGYKYTPDFFFNMCTSLIKNIEKAHLAGVIIGDLNDSNVLVEPSGSTSLIDCDSFQIGGFLCTVNRPEFLSPDLHSKPLDKTRREPFNDIFSLAVLLWQLIFGGIHPFAGKVNGAGGTIECIQKGLCVGNKNYSPPLFQYDFQQLPKQILNLFTNSFNLQPTSSKEWLRAFNNNKLEIKKFIRSSLKLKNTGPKRTHKQQQFSPQNKKTNRKQWLITVAALLFTSFLLSVYFEYKQPSLINSFKVEKQKTSSDMKIEEKNSYQNKNLEDLQEQQSFSDRHKAVFEKTTIHTANFTTKTDTKNQNSVNFSNTHNLIFNKKTNEDK